ncbi:hypothetical protein GCM10027275_16550 [Rhabdobacter roseus]|uniref:Uncharacterized protein n=1 Tax=Rhabdobacter roseus TaxID=1655419 RepID=A0A840THE9_9BACT|nr:hypothetical protein [Rhabdobacter roseus]MBB5283576.1 hypothetical protein [Rhabdobacter roseus]
MKTNQPHEEQQNQAEQPMKTPAANQQEEVGGGTPTADLYDQLNELLSRWPEFRIGEMTTETLADIKEGGGIGSCIVKYMKVVEEDLAEENLPKKKLLDKAAGLAVDGIKEYLVAIHELLAHPHLERAEILDGRALPGTHILAVEEEPEEQEEVIAEPTAEELAMERLRKYEKLTKAFFDAHDDYEFFEQSLWNMLEDAVAAEGDASEKANYLFMYRRLIGHAKELERLHLGR